MFLQGRNLGERGERVRRELGEKERKKEEKSLVVCITGQKNVGSFNFAIHVLPTIRNDQ